MRTKIEGISFAVDEHIWGHRLYDEQLPYLTLLEFLGVLASNIENPLISSPTDRVQYRPQRQIRLRGLLFNNPYIDSIKTKNLSDDDKWKDWNDLFSQDATGYGDNNMDYLRNVFLSFDDFAKAIELLRSSGFEATSNKRWSSKFVFPFGPDALYEDLRIDANGASNDRRFFARTGEILYLMLSRASNGPELGKVLVDRLFNSTSPMNRLIRALQGEPQLAPDSREVGYLPHSKHKRFDQICDDWLSILSRDMPVYDALEHLTTNAGLNLLLYFLECAKTQAGDAEPVEIICEIISRERTKVRALSCNSYQENQALSYRAIRVAVESIKLTEQWESALKTEDPDGECSKILYERFQWPSPVGDDEEDYSGSSGEILVQKLVEKAESRHSQHFGKIHSTWSRAIGLSSRRLSRRIRYAPNDLLLKTMVITIVEDQMQFDEFLNEVHKRYGLVIGDAEGAHLVKNKQVDQEALSDNRGNLETRLVGLGLLRRLSDSCSFVENPFSSKKEI
ncbi:hypothetical protein GALL_269780 [mine drainage metagenome]|uniref:Uncharacterized protein n=1 Tax=mine drainage metagenome TaxID=410659 RepID=A0A1J5RST1_9ZZZZ